MNTEPYTHYGTLRDPKKHTRAQRSVGLVVVGSSTALVAAAWVAAVATAVLRSLGREAWGVQPPGYISIAHSRASQADRVGHVSRRPNEKGLVGGEDAVVHWPLPLQTIPAGGKRIPSVHAIAGRHVGRVGWR